MKIKLLLIIKQFITAVASFSQPPVLKVIKNHDSGIVKFVLNFKDLIYFRNM